MKIIDTLTEEQLSSINKLIKSYNKNNEFEISVFSNKETSNEFLTMEKFKNVNSILTKITENNKDADYVMKMVTMMNLFDGSF